MQPVVSIAIITAGTVLEAIVPFEPDDQHKGTFLVMRIAGADKKAALRLVNRKYRSWQEWRASDEDFLRLDDQIPALQNRFGGEARVLRTAMLDISIIEAGIMVFSDIITGKKINSDMWAYATKLAGLRVPLMKAIGESESPWEKLANSIKNTMLQRELSVKEIDEHGTEKLITAKETVIHPNPVQMQLANEIVGRVLNID